MKKVFLSIVALAALVVLPMSVSAQNTDEATATGRVLILSPISIVKVTDLNFGAVALGVGNTGGTVTIVPGSNVRTPVGVSLASVAAYDYNSPSYASFDITGDNSNAFGIEYGGNSSAAGLITLAEGLTIQLTGEGTSGALLASETLSATGTYSLKLGGVLTIPNSITPGEYSKTFDVTVTYE